MTPGLQRVVSGATRAFGPQCSPRWDVLRGVPAYLGGSELLGMKAKSRRGKKSLGPIIPKPLVRFGCILRSRNKPHEL